MRRRRALLAIAGAALALATPAFAQRQGKVWRIGFLAVASKSTAGHLYDAFLQGMRELGYVEGKNLAIEWRFADANYERLPALAAELVNLKVDLILASSTPAIAAAKRATTTIPIVMGVSADPVGAGLVKSLARPGGNVTGGASAVADYSPKQVELLVRIVPGVSRIGLIVNRGNPAHKSSAKSLEAAAKRSGISVDIAEIRSEGDIADAFDTHVKLGAKAIVVAPDGLFMQHRAQIAGLAARHRIPVMYGLREHVDAGGLISYGQSNVENYRLAASYVDKIFRGAAPADLPIEMIRKLELVINGKTAKALGLSIPNDVLFLADKVLE